MSGELGRQVAYVDASDANALTGSYFSNSPSERVDNVMPLSLGKQPVVVLDAEGRDFA